jgi:hypothetical protein
VAEPVTADEVEDELKVLVEVPVGVGGPSSQSVIVVVVLGTASS